MTILLHIIIVILSFVAMEAVAWSAHKYLMHGLMWKIHKDHHRKEVEGIFEKNDLFFLIFSIPGIIGLLIGVAFEPLRFCMSIGIGITLYGLAYFLVHDVFIHQRIKWFRRTDHPYFRAIRKAHKLHHKNQGKEHGRFFGMLWLRRKDYRKLTGVAG